jgi:hypothetical protein
LLAPLSYHLYDSPVSESPYSIAVVGAGLGGLVLAWVVLDILPILAWVLQLLYDTRGHDVRLRRKPKSAVSISHTGTSLAVLSESGQYASETAQLIAQLRNITLLVGEEWKLKMMDKHGTVVFEDIPLTAHF